VAFFRFSRDKRGYEHFYLVEAVTNRKGKSRSRVLYWYRTPPNVKVGRAPFDDEVRRALEKQYPDVSFDWTKIVDAPIPSADAEKWRERRRTERAERAARRQADGESSADPRSEDSSEDIDAVLTLDEDEGIGATEASEGVEPAAAASAATASPGGAGRASSHERSGPRRRRRRRGPIDPAAREGSNEPADANKTPAAAESRAPDRGEPTGE